MHELLHMAGMRLRMLRHAALEFVRGSKLRLLVVCTLVVLFWCLMFGMFMDAFMFLRGFPALSALLLDYLFAFFFLSLLVMMTISNGIIAYASLYRSEETAFLFSLPVPPESTFVCRGADSMAFSTWGMATLVVPMIVAYGAAFRPPAHFYAFGVLLAGLFVLLATELGALFALLVAIVLPRRRRDVLIALGAAAAAATAFWFYPLLCTPPRDVLSESSIRAVMDKITISQHWALPSFWVSFGMLSAARGVPREAVFHALLLLANALFVGMAAHRLSHYVYRRTWMTVQGNSSARRFRASVLFERAANGALAFLPGQMRLLVVKDLKTFARDPTQWSQVLLFFGLLALYVLNLPRFGVGSLPVYWHSLIANLNLCAACLTLATLTSRFVFPQLSLEGRRIWITGLMPMRRTTILWGKFFFAVTGTFLVSAALVLLSDVLLGLPGWMMAVHVVTVGGVCCGLNGLAVGLGALYPRLGTDNPSKIVSSFGGTLNLICSICYLALTLAVIVAPLHWHAVGMLTGMRSGLSIGLGMALMLGASAGACVVPMLAGARAFTRMEF